MKVSIGVSNHHVHLKQSDVEILFGTNYVLEKIKDLNQPGEYVSSATVIVQTNKGILENVRVLGPVRSYTQVEVSKTDAYKLGIDPPIRNSGDIRDSASVTLIGPNGSIDLDEGCIIATRHIHLTHEHVKLYGLDGLKYVSVYISGDRGGILHNVALKVSDKAYFELHLDLDDANAHLLKNGDVVDIIEVPHA